MKHDAYRKAMQADAAWSAELARLFGKKQEMFDTPSVEKALLDLLFADFTKLKLATDRALFKARS